MKSEAKAQGVQYPPNLHFRPGVLGANGLHDAPTLFWAARIHRNSLPSGQYQMEDRFQIQSEHKNSAALAAALAAVKIARLSALSTFSQLAR